MDVQFVQLKKEKKRVCDERHMIVAYKAVFNKPATQISSQLDAPKVTAAVHSYAR